MKTLISSLYEPATVKKTTPKAVKIAYVASGFYPDGSVAGWGLNSYRAVQLGVQHAKKNKWAGKDYELELPEDLVFQANGTNSTQLIDFIRYSFMHAPAVCCIWVDM